MSEKRFQDMMFVETAKLRIENKKLKEENEQLRKVCSHLKKENQSLIENIFDIYEKVKWVGR